MTTDTVGGVWTYSAELTAGLLREGVAVALVTVGRAPSAGQIKWLEQAAAYWGKAFLWDVSEVPLEWMSNNGRAFCDGVPLLLRIARAFGASLFHSNQLCFGALPVSFPRLVVAHSDVLSWATACRGGAIEAGPWLDTYARLTAAGLRNADAVVAPSRWMLDALAVNFELPCQARVIANGRTLPAPRFRAVRKLQAVTAGRFWDEAKNLKLLEEVAAPFPILVAGETGSDIRREMRMLGPLAQEDMLRLFEESAIYLCTSKYEPFGLAPLEAALCGCAVLVNDIASLREVWGDGALYFCDASSLSTLLAQLEQNPQQLTAAQNRSWRRAQRYTAARMAGEYLALYQQMLRTAQTATNIA